MTPEEAQDVLAIRPRRGRPSHYPDISPEQLQHFRSRAAHDARMALVRLHKSEYDALYAEGVRARVEAAGA